MISLIWAVLAVLPASIATSEYSHSKHHRRQQQGGEAFQLEELKQGYEAEVRQTFNARCNENNVIRRKEWGNMSPAERQDYIRATRCLNNLPSKSHDFYAPGAQNRRDDFTVAHIANHEKVHFSPWTLSFHSWFIWLYEQALRNECGYQGGLPYMAYEKYGYQSLEQTPLFDGSDLSFGTNGFLQPDGCHCIDGPFADFQCHLGPIAGGHGCRPNPQANGLGFNPRCLEREFNYEHLGNLTVENVYESITLYTDIGNFCLRFENYPGGLHSTPHEIVGGAQSDIPGSPCDPWFWSHHCGLDRLWRMWQSLDYNDRMYALPPPEQYAAERVSRGWQPTELVTPDSWIYVSPILDGIRVGDMMSTTGGPFCYIYE
ncbi:hypothetical protein CKM354_000766700 [Cercospora kikuchii]|uniref:Tyrosinase copper-binding domain-containing protein n=1 Tax=Cercospora kikuchii TaxID=84275 RepID=A0A9P3CRK5_9PEZI|nr:uncharacterized protein CKM354_000766700 [Cercospora kikuchii]GIZ44470.1 hypothetical protein CKM354_000766700 [Cercospora kikuchii]